MCIKEREQSPTPASSMLFSVCSLVYGFHMCFFFFPKMLSHLFEPLLALDREVL
jgi:hypothetical protein